jgi:serine/threonine-protein kinase
MNLFGRRKATRVVSALEGEMLGKYRVLEPLGRGGMARVYRAYHAQLDRYVALKVLRGDLLHDDDFFDRFRREARAVAALRHPNIVQVFDYDVEDRISYMVLELLDGDSLKTRLHDYRIRGERMALGEMVRILCQVLDGLSYAHAKGMVHRDVKPGNILLTKDGRAVVADFGIARIVGSASDTVPGALLGTMSYIAPEQGLKGKSDPRSDLYSLGVVLYEMVTGRTPFEADTPAAVLMKHAQDPLPLPRQLEPSIPEPFERVLLKAMAKDPDDRYADANAMARALIEAAEEAGVELPARVSPPLSFTTPEAPSDSVAVFSGEERDQLRDTAFASEETATTVESPSALDRLRAGQPLFAPGTAVLLAMGLVAVGNLSAFAIAAVVGFERVFQMAWPMELFLLSAGLSVVMHAVGSSYLMIPLGILFGSGFIFTYCTVTGQWRHWLFLWVFQLWVIAGSVLAARWLDRRPRPRRLNRLIPLVIAPLALVLSSLLVLASTAVGLADAVSGFAR